MNAINALEPHRALESTIKKCRKTFTGAFNENTRAPTDIPTANNLKISKIKNLYSI